MEKTECCNEKTYRMMPLIGDAAPAFTANTTQGVINFPDDYKGKWAVLFSHPADFTPVCTTEFMTFALRHDEFKALNTELIGLSVDSLFSHIAWLRKIEELDFSGVKGLEKLKNIKVNFPLIDDIKMEVANKYGMIQPNQSTQQAVRAVFIIDPQGKIRAMIYYPMALGRNFDEILRAIKGLQKSDKDGVAIPADWQPGNDTIVPPAATSTIARDRMANPGDGKFCAGDWFMCFKKD